MPAPPRDRTFVTTVALALMGLVGVVIGAALLLVPIGYVPGESCGSVVLQHHPDGDDSAVQGCADLYASHRDGAIVFLVIGAPVLAAAGGRAWFLR